MKPVSKFFAVVCLSGFFLANGMVPVFAGEVERVRAKIGVKIKRGEQVYRAKSRERIQAGDLLRIYVHPERSSYIYVVHTDGKTAQLLNLTRQKAQSSTLVLPSVQTYYKVDGKSPREGLVIVCSPEELPDLSGLEKGDTAYDEWAKMEKGLVEKSRVVVTGNDEPRFEIAGNVRGVGPGDGDPFVEELRVFSGKGVLVKKYELEVRK